jgi:hypothetical protein
MPQDIDHLIIGMNLGGAAFCLDIDQALNRASRTLFATDDRLSPTPPTLNDPRKTRLRHEGWSSKAASGGPSVVGSRSSDLRRTDRLRDAAQQPPGSAGVRCIGGWRGMGFEVSARRVLAAALSGIALTALSVRRIALFRPPTNRQVARCSPATAEHQPCDTQLYRRMARHGL